MNPNFVTPRCGECHLTCDTLPVLSDANGGHRGTCNATRRELGGAEESV